MLLQQGAFLAAYLNKISKKDLKLSPLFSIVFKNEFCEFIAKVLSVLSVLSNERPNSKI